MKDGEFSAWKSQYSEGHGFDFRQGSNFFLSHACINKYLLLTEFEGRSVNYGPRFSPSIYGPSAKRAGYKSKGKNKGP